jgi:DNA-binding beta-propeller fold protein YncE
MVLLIAVVVASVVVLGRTSGSHRLAQSPRQAYEGTASAAFVSKSGLIYVADQGSNSLLELDPSATPPFSPVATIPLTFTPGVVAVSSDGAMAYVSPLVPEFAGGSNTLYEVDLATHRVVRTISDPSQPLGSITLAPDGKIAYAWGDGIVPIELSSGRILPPISRSQLAYTDFEISPNGKTAIATSEGPTPSIQMLNLRTRNVTRTVSTKNLHLPDTTGFWSPQSAAFSPNGATAYVTAQQERRGSYGTLLTVSLASGRIERSTGLGSGGVGNVVVSPGGAKAFVLIQVPVVNVYTGVFTVESVGLVGDRHVHKIVIGETQGLGLLQLASKHNLYGIDTNWKVATINERTDRVVAISTIPVPSLYAATLQPFSFPG